MEAAVAEIKADMINVPALRFTGFKNDWNIVKLNSCLSLLTDFEANGSFASVKENVKIYDKQEYAWYVRATDLENGSSLESVKYVDEHGYKFLKKTSLFGGELLITKRGEIGKVYFYDDKYNVKATVAPNMYLLKLKENTSPKFLYYYFIGKKGNNQLKSINASSTIGALYKDDVKNLKLSLPTLSEQQKIASFLTAVDDKIQQLTKKKDLLEKYKEGVMQQIFSQQIRFKDEDGQDFPEWQTKKLGEVSNINPKSKTLPISFVYIDLESVVKGILIKESSILAEGAPSRAQRVLAFGDILFQMVRPYQKNNLFFQKEGDYVASTGYAQIRSKGDANYLYQFIHTDLFVNKVLDRCTGTSYPAINSSDLSAIEIDYPSLPEQEKIGGILSSLDSKINLVNKQLEQAKQFKKGLLQQMFV
ncbi:restriction endonuclease subunit S [Rufibacter sp. DG15C]|uniref:restriction endonuclease subunit S n=1 Tax=Rufibacter sp. DG15C TaxID=1379909 RepID=UPI00082F69AB|nr:restriction endonuclease subunit S [Rufibacter sp. DG15C]